MLRADPVSGGSTLTPTKTLNEPALCLWGICNAMYTQPVESLTDDLRKALQASKCTETYAEYLISYVVPSIGFCVGDVVSDLRPEEFAVQYCGVDIHKAKEGIYSDAGAEYREHRELFQALSGIPPNFHSLYRLSEEQLQAAKISWPKFLESWKEQFHAHYGRTAEEARTFYKTMSLEERLAL